MQAFVSDPAWLEIVREQEQRLRLRDFSSEDALALGLSIIRLAGARYGGNVAVAIMCDDMVVFAYKMPGTGLENEWWMRRKRNVSRATGVSSLLAYLEIIYGGRKITWQNREAEYAACGGAVPLKNPAGDVLAYVLVSGLEHNLDHQLIMDALSEHLGISIKSVV